jgi:hypothetical protein
MNESCVCITIETNKDFVSFFITLKHDDVLAVGDKLRFADDCESYIARRIFDFRSKLSIAYECEPIVCLEDYDLYKNLEIFRSRYEFHGSFNTNRPDPVCAYKLYRIYRSFMNEEESFIYEIFDDARRKSLHDFSKVLGFDIVGMPDRIQEVDMLFLFMKCNNHAYIDFEGINIDDLREIFRSL